MNDFLSFKKMITPIFIQIIFWIYIAIVVIGGLVMISQDQALTGILVIILGPIFVRVFTEILIVIFRINDTLTEISDSLIDIKRNTQHPNV